MNPELEAFQLVLERHQNGASENDIRTSFQGFLVATGIAAWSDMSTEVPAGIGRTGRIDLYVHNTCIEFKRDIRVHGAVRQEDVDQLDGYLTTLLTTGNGVRSGILTDGVNYLIRRIGDNTLPTYEGEPHQEFQHPDQTPRLREYLHSVISVPADHIQPTAVNLQQYFGAGSELFRACNLLLQKAYNRYRDTPTVAVKRRLWQDLLQVALGQDSATAGDESDWLFIRHTYITSLIAAIMQERLLGDVGRHAAERPDALLKGRILAQESDLHGIIDADLFTWPGEVETRASTYLQEIARVVQCFDWTDQAWEVAPTLYQHVISSEERKRLGEYYTPSWLAREITVRTVDNPLQQRVLDPSCGSGTFIETAVRHILDHATGLPQTEILAKLQQNIVGIDIHPVAVQLAKATWVLAASDTIRGARRENPEIGAVTAPIYLGDSLQLRYDTGSLYVLDNIELATGETLSGRNEPVTFRIPRTLARRQADIDWIITAMAAAVDDGRDAARVADRLVLDEHDRQSLQDVAAAMRDLHLEGRNHVWAYYIRNMIRPAIIAEKKVDCIVGNPPWLTYSQSADIIRQELRAMSERYRIWTGGRQAPHQDVATLFHVRCAELYAKPGTVIGMVMPHSVLRSGQHLKWRRGLYTTQEAGAFNLNLQVYAPWDLYHVEPNLFPMPASVVFAEVGRDIPLAPGTVKVWRGNWQKDSAGITRQQVALHHDDGLFKSPYAALSSQGATIVDRRLFFVETLPHKAHIPAGNATRVRPRRGRYDKLTYQDQLNQLPEVVPNEHLFDVYLGECLAPYMALTPLKAALPIHRDTMELPLNHSDCEATHREGGKHDACRLDVEALHPTMQQRWQTAAGMYHKAHPTQTIKKLHDRLNYQNILINQLTYLRNALAGSGTTRVIYASSGRPTAAIVTDNRAIVDYTLFQTICTSDAEAYYVLAIMNSRHFEDQVGMFMPKGQYGPRHFQKHGWKLPIPRYNSSIALHIRLSELGNRAATECVAWVAEHNILVKPAGVAQSDAARKLLRYEWQPHSTTAQAIEEAVAELLDISVQTVLAR